MVRSALLNRARQRAYSDLEEEERIALASERNVDYATRIVNMSTRGFICEKGITTSGLESTNIPEIIANRNWARLTHVPPRYHPVLVREFYASMVPDVFDDSGIVWVRGIQLVVNADAINDYLSTARIPRLDQYDGLPGNIRRYYTPQDIARSLRRADVEVPANEVLYHGDLRPEIAFWDVFFTWSLFPSTHRTVVSDEIAQVLFAIQRGTDFDFGRIIVSQILKAARAMRGHLLFPSLITHFCRQANIADAYEEAQLESAKKNVGRMAYNSFCTHHHLPNVSSGGRYRNKGRGAAEQSQDAGSQGGRGSGAGSRGGRGSRAQQSQAPVGDQSDVPPPWASQLVQSVDEVRTEQIAMRSALNQVARDINRRYTSVVYTRGPRGVVLQQGPSSQQQDDDSD